MKISLLALLAVAHLTLGHEIGSVKLVKLEVDEAPPHLKCETVISYDVIPKEMKIYKLKDGLKLLAKVTPEGVEVNPEYPPLDPEEPIKPLIEVITATGELTEELALLEVRFPGLEEKLAYGEYICELLYVAPHRDYERMLERSPKVTIGTSLELLEKVEETKLKVEKVSEDLCEFSIRKLIWPGGDYATLMPRAGCPTEDLAKWAVSTRTHTTESTDPNHNENKTADHMPEDLFYVEDGIYLANLSYCSRFSNYSGVSTWPKGSYCINRRNDECPEGFEYGYIKFDDEDDVNQNEVHGDLPDGEYSHNTIYRYCCRDDKAHIEPMQLPIKEPFYLYRYGGECQLVQDMDVVNDYILLDTANIDSHGDNADAHDGAYPDSELNPLKLQLCYYEPKPCL